jgi:hypothetical protein
MYVEIKNIKLKSEDLYNGVSYPGPGLYFVRPRKKDDFISCVMFVYKDLTGNTYPMQLIDLESFKKQEEYFEATIEETKEETPVVVEEENNKVSEDFALQMLSVALHKEKLK